MHRRRLVRLVVGTGILATLALVQARASTQRSPRARPNIVLLISDDHDYEHLGFMGSATAHTPALDALSEAGVVFTTAHVPIARCRPSLAALLSGTWPHQNGVFFNTGPTTLAPDRSLPGLLARAGYATYVGGKFWEGDPAAMGFTDGLPPDRNAFVRAGQADLFAFIERTAGERPMFIWWSPKLPHLPHNPPERFVKRFSTKEIPVPAYVGKRRAAEYVARERELLAMTAWFDEGVDELCAKLREVGEYDSTVFAFLIDNGYANGLVSKGSPFEKGLRTPMIVSYADGVPAGMRSDALSSTLDLYPTLLDFAGVEIPERAVGHSLRPIIDGSTSAVRDVLCGAAFPRLVAANVDASEAAFALHARDTRWKYILFLDDVDRDRQRDQTAFSVARVVEWKRGEERLFDLANDPYELTNLAGLETHRATIKRLRAAALDWWTGTGGAPLRLPSVLDSKR